MQTIKGRPINEKPLNLRALGQSLKGKLAESLGLVREPSPGQMNADSGRRGWLEITHLYLIDRVCTSSSMARGKHNDSLLLKFDDGRTFQIKLANYSERHIKMNGETWVGEISFENLSSIVAGRMLEGISYISSSGNGPQDVDFLSLILSMDSQLVIALTPGSLKGIGFQKD